MSERGSLAQALFSPRAIALIGASGDPAKNTSRPQRVLRLHGYAGRIVPINATRAEVLGERAYHTLAAAPGEIDHAFIMTPGEAVERAIEECGARGVPVATIFSDGFADAGAEGAARQERLVARARALGVRAGVADVALLALLALAILVAVRGLGNLLVVALLVGPAATARLLVRRMWPMMALAAAIAVGCGTAGLYLSYHAGTAAGASIAGAIVVAFLVAELAAGRPRRVGAGAPTAPDAPHLLGAPGR